MSRPTPRTNRLRCEITRVAVTLFAVSLLNTSATCAAPILGPILSNQAVGQAGFGTIKGRLVWGGEQIPEVPVLEGKGKAAKDPEICARDTPILDRKLVVDPTTRGVAYGFAYIVKPSGDKDKAVAQLVAAHPTVELDQKNCEFQPYVLPMYEGQTLIVKASDPSINHNVHVSALTNGGSNQNAAPGAELKFKFVAENFPIEIKCDIHPWMNSYVMVFDHPFFATTAKDGRFEIKGIPAGPQRLMVRHNTVGYVTPGRSRGMPIEVKAGEVTDVGEIVLKPAEKKPGA